MGAASGSDGGRSPRRCALMPSLSSELAHFHQQEGTIIATFTNAQAHAFALNWARQLHAIGLSSLVGASEDLGPAARHAFADARGGLFCAAGAQMRRNGQAAFAHTMNLELHPRGVADALLAELPHALEQPGISLPAPYLMRAVATPATSYTYSR